MNRDPFSKRLFRPAGQTFTRDMANTVLNPAEPADSGDPAEAWQRPNAQGQIVTPDGTTRGGVGTVGNPAATPEVCELPPRVYSQGEADAWNAAHPGCAPAVFRPAANEQPAAESKNFLWFLAGVGVIGAVAWSVNRKPSRGQRGEE